MNSADRRKAEDDLITLKPDLLMLCPPCADQGSRFHLNSTKWDTCVELPKAGC
jgi:hypothetical protein